MAIATIEDMRDPDRGPAARPHLDLDDDQLHGGDPAGALSARSPGSAGFAWKDLSGTVQNDLLKEYIARGTYIFPPRESLKITTDLFAFCGREVPRWNTISISGYHIREAGSTAVQEVAFTLSNAIAYVEAALARGLAIDDFAPRLSFFFNAHSNFFEEVAKFRAARSLWAEIARDRFGAKDPRSWRLRFHTQTAGSTLTAQQPDVNVVRVALQALSAVLGGTQSLHTNAARRGAGAADRGRRPALALRTQQVIAYESGVADVVDPLGGSFLVEAWTDADPRARAGAHREGRRPRRRGRGDRAGLLPARDRGGGLPRAARDRGRPADRRRASTPSARRARPRRRSSRSIRGSKPSRSSACAPFAPRATRRRWAAARDAPAPRRRGRTAT